MLRDEIYSEDTLQLTLTFTTTDKTVFDPSTITVTLTDPSGDVEETDYDLYSFIRVKEGVYTLDFNVPSSAESGEWIIVVAATAASGAKNTKKIKFYVSE